MTKDIVYDSELGLKLDVYDAGKASPVLVYYYGGGLERGCKEDSKSLAEDISKNGITVVVPDYHICPGQSYPEFVETAALAVKAAATFAKGRPLFIGGHSSGAYVAMMLCFGGFISDIKVSGYIFASGQTTTHSGILQQRGIDTKRMVVDDASPLYNVSGKYPPILLTVGAKDSFPCRVEQNILLSAAIKSANRKASLDFSILPDETHGSYLERRGEQPSLFCDMVTGFIRAHV